MGFNTNQQGLHRGLPRVFGFGLWALGLQGRRLNSKLIQRFFWSAFRVSDFWLRVLGLGVLNGFRDPLEGFTVWGCALVVHLGRLSFTG